MMENSDKKSVSLSPAEIQLLDALILLEEEARAGDVHRVTVFDPPDALGIWVKAGKWLWKHRKKVVALTTTVTDFIGDFQIRAETEMRRVADANFDTGADDATLDDLIAAREAVARAVKDAGAKNDN